MKDFLRRNGIWLLVIALLLSILIVVSSAFMGGNADPLSNLVTTITTPVRNGAAAVGDFFQGVSRYVFHYGEMEQQISDCWTCGSGGGTLSLSPPRSPPGPTTTGAPPSP